MALAEFRKVYGKNGSGRLVVSEGIAPAEPLTPHPGLPTWYYDSEDDRFEVVITQGTIISLVTDGNGDSRVVPCNGTGSNQTWGDADTVDPETGATPTDVAGDEDTVTVGSYSTPIGVAQQDLLRPFDKGTSQLSSWITYGYVEWPMIQALNDTLVAGDLVTSDHMGRPVELSAGDYATRPHTLVAKVVAVEKFATNFDDGLLSYMVLPSDPGALKHVYELTKSGPYSGKLGIRANLDHTNVIGAFRAYLCL